MTTVTRMATAKPMPTASLLTRDVQRSSWYQYRWVSSQLVGWTKGSTQNWDPPEETSPSPNPFLQPQGLLEARFCSTSGA